MTIPSHRLGWQGPKEVLGRKVKQVVGRPELPAYKGRRWNLQIRVDKELHTTIQHRAAVSGRSISGEAEYLIRCSLATLD